MSLETTAKRLKKGAMVLEEIAADVASIEDDLSSAEHTVVVREDEIRRLEEIQDAAPLIEDLEDVRRGTFTFDEICERWGIDPRWGR